MTESLSSFASLFRAVLILHGREAPIAKPDCVRATVKLLRLDPAPFERIFAIRATGEKAGDGRRSKRCLQCLHGAG